MPPIRSFRPAKAAPISLPRAILLAFMLVAFVSQSFATQTHIHGSTPSSAFGIDRILMELSGDDGVFAPAGPAQKHDPAKSDPAHCVFCQAVSYAGAFVSPAAALLVLAPQNFSVIPSQISVPAWVEIVPHFWHGRAPPQL
jgi:hypothetical protein